MKFPDSISQAELRKISRQSLLLFLSVDIVNSTALKEKFRRKNENWLEIAYSFYTKFPSLLSSSLAIEGDINLSPFLWKAIGDELVFVAEIQIMEEIPIILDAFRDATNKWNKGFERTHISVKSTAWLAGFPVNNSMIPGDVENHYDYIGSSMDTGFRLGRFASPRKFVLSIEIVYVLAKLSEAHVQGLHYSGKNEMKGVLNGQPYPLFWIDCFEGNEVPQFAALARLEEIMTGDTGGQLDGNEISAFVSEWIQSTDDAINTPFCSGKPDDRFPIPEAYERKMELAVEDLEQVWLEEGESGNEEGKKLSEKEFKRLFETWGE